MPFLQILGLVVFWLVIIGLFLAIYIYLGSLAYSWYMRRKKEKQDKPPTHSL